MKRMHKLYKLRNKQRRKQRHREWLIGKPERLKKLKQRLKLLLRGFKKSVRNKLKQEIFSHCLNSQSQYQNLNQLKATWVWVLILFNSPLLWERTWMSMTKRYLNNIWKI